MIATLDLHTHDGAKQASVWTFTLTGWLRINEAIVTDSGSRTKWDDIKDIPDSEDFIFNLRDSKMARFGPSVDIPMFSTQDDLCAAKRLRRYKRFLKPEYTRGSQPIFVNKDGTPYTDKKALSAIRSAIGKVLRNADPMLYSTHSFRAGAATWASAHGMSAAMIEIMGRWAPNSKSAKKYNRPSIAQMLSAARAVHQQYESKPYSYQQIQSPSSSHPPTKKVRFLDREMHV